jgi:hypothetical protein
MDGIDSGQAARAGGLPSSALAILHRVWDPAIAVATSLLHDNTILTADLPTLTRAVHAAIEGTGELAAAISTEMATMEARVEALEARLGMVEQRGLPYAGVWRHGEVYTAGTLVTFDGSLWYSRAETTDRPGDGRTAWVLAVKRGKDGKDLRP